MIVAVRSVLVRLIDEKRKLSAKAKSLETALEKAQRVKSETETTGSVGVLTLPTLPCDVTYWNVWS